MSTRNKLKDRILLLENEVEKLDRALARIFAVVFERGNMKASQIDFSETNRAAVAGKVSRLDYYNGLKTDKSSIIDFKGE